ncbi:MAG: class A beta-lactamase [Methyloceanibacter sp.]
MITRRELTKGAASLLVVSGCMARGRPARAGLTLERALADIEVKIGGRLGVAVFDTGSGFRAGHRAGERFPLCSTFKLLAAAAILARVDAGKDRLDRRVAIAPGDMVTYSPVTERHIGGSLSLAELCEAAITQSDNTAGNLLLEALGGPEGLTAYARSLGDETTRLDRVEPDLNEARPGDLRDTTTPVAMVGNFRALLVGNALSAGSKEQLTAWLVGNQTGYARLRAGLPAAWRVGDKTGSGEHGTTNDVGAAWPPGGAPILIAVYLTETEAEADARNAALADVARAVAAAMPG